MKHASRLSATAALAALGLAAGGGALAADLPAVITIAGPSQAASGYVMATGYGTVITKYTSIRKVVVQPFAGGEAWPSHMQAGNVNFGQHCAFKPVIEAYRGEGVFKNAGPMRNIRHVARGYGLAWGFHTVDSDVKRIADLKGKSVFYQPSHTDLENAVKIVLSDAGLTLNKDVKGLPFRSPQEAIQGLRTGRGGTMAYGAIPGLAELKRGKGVRTLPLSDATMDKIYESEPIWGKTVIKAGTGPTAPAEDTPTLQVQCGLAAGTQTSADTVYAVTKAIYEHLDEWKSVHPLARQWTLARALDIFVVPYHDGAVRFYKEKGVWTAQHEARQKALLAN